eukprot:gene15707-23988_t
MEDSGGSCDSSRKFHQRRLNTLYQLGASGTPAPCAAEPCFFDCGDCDQSAAGCANSSWVCLAADCALDCSGRAACASAGRPLAAGYGLYCGNGTKTCAVACTGNQSCARAGDRSYCGASEVCSFDCSGSEACAGFRAVCGAGASCRLDCAAPGACAGVALDAADAGSARVECTSPLACANGTVRCPAVASNCTVACSGSQACRGLTVVCPPSRVCSVECRGDAACGEMTLHGSVTVVVPGAPGLPVAQTVVSFGRARVFSLRLAAPAAAAAAPGFQAGLLSAVVACLRAAGADVGSGAAYWICPAAVCSPSCPYHLEDKLRAGCSPGSSSVVTPSDLSILTPPASNGSGCEVEVDLRTADGELPDTTGRRRIISTVQDEVLKGARSPLHEFAFVSVFETTSEVRRYVEAVEDASSQGKGWATSLSVLVVAGVACIASCACYCKRIRYAKVFTDSQ